MSRRKKDIEKPINFELTTDYSNKDYQEKDIERFFKEGGDVGFNPKRNKYVIESTLQNNIKLYKAKVNHRNAILRERAEATYDYANYLNSGKSGNAERYFGKRELARLRGIEFAQEQKRVIGLKDSQNEIIIASK